MSRHGFLNSVLLAAVLSIAVFGAGCATKGQYLGTITDDSIADGVDLFLARNELAGLLTKDQTRRFLEAVRANETMLQLGIEIDSQVADSEALQKRIADLASRYIKDGVFVNPSQTNAVPATAE